MNSLTRNGLLVLLAMMWVACGDMLLGSDPEDTPASNFDVLWEDFDKTYSFFEYKGVNWDSLYAVYRPQVTAQTSETQLFETMAALLDHLQDGHVNLYTPFSVYAYANPKVLRAPANVLAPGPFRSRYVPQLQGNDVMRYGPLTDDIGYVAITRFAGPSDAFRLIDEVIDAFQSMQGIVIDVRNNGGGSDTNADIVASRFTDQRRLFRYVQYRNGPAHTDFTPLLADYLEPGGPAQYTRPIVLLTNRRCASTTEDFTLAMQVLPHATVVGDTTAGALGNPVIRALPNGWNYRLSRWIELSADKVNYEGLGIPPDVPVWISPSDSLQSRDRILEEAVALLRRSAGAP